MEKKDWVLKYLKGQKAPVRVVDLKEFFVIQNRNKKVKQKEIDVDKWSYELEYGFYEVHLALAEKPKNHYFIEDVIFTAKENENEEN